MQKGYIVHGIVRRTANESEYLKYSRINHILNDIKIHTGSLESFPSLYKIIDKVKPDELYHLAAQSFVKDSFEDEFSTFNSNVNGTHYILSALRDICPTTKFYFAGSSEMFGKVSESPQNENTKFHPRSPYGISKVTGFDLTRNYREAYNLHCSTGILFNHESPRRGFEFVTRKISHGVARIKYGLQKDLSLGNLESKRDWGHAKDYIEAMWLMVQQRKPDDFVIATNEQHSVKEFVKVAFSIVGLDYKKFIKIDKNLYRPAEVQTLLGDYSKARRVLKWKPKVSFESLVKDMVLSDLKFVKKSGY
mgnify:CR=1 FL=1